MNEQKFAEKDVLKIKEILKDQLNVSRADQNQLEPPKPSEEEFHLLKAYVDRILEQESVTELDPNYEGTFKELSAYITEREKSKTLIEHVEINHQNLKRWIDEIDIYNSKETVTTDKNQARKTNK